MPAVFVHGNPECDAIWGPLIGELDRSDVVCLSPPGFGAPVPDGFPATMDAYRHWLASELGGIDGPIDLVGHDWGGGHVLNVVTTQPELVRSWCADVLGIFHPGYVWHDLAAVWRTPGDGEALVEAMMTGPAADRIALYEAQGITAEVARSMVEASGDDMGRCILALYRSAPPEVLAQGWERLPTARARPGLALVAADDHYVGTREQAGEAAGRAGAAVTVLEGVGHWWMVQDPRAGATALQRFWDGLE